MLPENQAAKHLQDFDLYDFKGLSQAEKSDEDPLFGDIDEKQSAGNALNITSINGTKIEFSRS